MESIKFCQRVGQDGVLHLEIPTGLTEREVEVMVIYQPLQSDHRSLEQLYGVCADDPITLDDRGILESSDDEMVGAFD
ncbi:MAG: hypothetical protein KME10_03990 [Plectolyngbya sp. WJT66-NPBG17]|jgi:hypothetical protein|nr:hypothetical protein [Plectolyngbya sp. WJT66-NPBG17]MBW4526596.1 hypothetical protein [Phormidium tanganyikae FI6-MK23]